MIVNQSHREDLVKIAKKLEKKAYSFPNDENGAPTDTYLEYLSLMYNPEIAKIVIHLSVFPEMMSIIKLAKILDMDKKELLEKLEQPAKRGFIMKSGRYFSQPLSLMMYDMPFVLKENYKQENIIDFAKLSRKFFEDGYYKTFETSRSGIPRFRVLTVSEEIEDQKEIIPIEEVYSIIDKNEDFAILPCPCRNRKEIEGIRQCVDKYPIHTCVAFGPYAKGFLEMGDPVIKAASKEEVKRITKEASEIGLIHGTDNRAENCMLLCACCECCCVMLSGLTRLDNPRAIAKANYICSIDSELCTGCETCLGRCKFGAITIDTVATLNPNKCLGCGLCAVTCPNDAISMHRYEREQIPQL